MVAWSGIGNSATWAPSIATQAGNLRLRDIPGRIMAMAPLGDAVAVYKRNGIWLLRYVGPPFMFAAELVERRGIAPNTNIVALEDGHIFIGNDDVYFFDGANTRSITTGRIGDHIRANYRSVVVGGAQWIHSEVMHNSRDTEIVFPGFNAVYNYQLDKWGTLPDAPLEIDQSWSAAYPVESQAPSITVSNGVGTPVAIDNVQTLFLSQSTSGSYRHKVYSIYKHPSDASTQTYEALNLTSWDIGNNGQASTIQRVVPKFRNVPTGTPTMTHRDRVVLGGAVQASTAGTWNATNYAFDIVKSAQWHRCEMTFPAVATNKVEVSGLEFSFASGGKRVESPLLPDTPFK
jgi:hypothetical protein